MPNPFFQFKQFTVFHDQCAMKVGTDGVLIGAWANCHNAKNILDIGTGSGLIALMLAQRSNASILGIDIDNDACLQAKSNVEQSPFAERINIKKCDYADFTFDTKYDLIVSNPPYFINSLQSPKESRTKARHNETLSIEALINKSSSILSPMGKIALILPYEQLKETDSIASEYKLYKIRETDVRPLPDSPFKRVLLEYASQPHPLESSTLCIELSRHIYSKEYIDLTKDFYLKL